MAPACPGNHCIVGIMVHHHGRTQSLTNAHAASATCRRVLLVSARDVSARAALEDVLTDLTESQVAMVAQM